MTPRWIRFLLPLRGLVQPLAERDAKKAHARDRAHLGAGAGRGRLRASAPVGAGGDAALEAEAPERV